MKRDSNSKPSLKQVNARVESALYELRVMRSKIDRLFSEVEKAKRELESLKRGEEPE